MGYDPTTSGLQIRRSAALSYDGIYSARSVCPSAVKRTVNTFSRLQRMRLALTCTVDTACRRYAAHVVICRALLSFLAFAHALYAARCRIMLILQCFLPFQLNRMHQLKYLHVRALALTSYMPLCARHTVTITRRPLHQRHSQRKYTVFGRISISCCTHATSFSSSHTSSFTTPNAPATASAIAAKIPSPIINAIICLHPLFQKIARGAGVAPASDWHILSVRIFSSRFLSHWGRAQAGHQPACCSFSA